MDALGDTVLTLPLLQSLRNRWPSASITYAAVPTAVTLLEDDPRVNHLLPVSYHQGSFHRISDWRQTCKALGGEDFDLAVLPRWDQDDYGCAAQSYLLGSRWIVGHRQQGRADPMTVGAWTDHLLTHPVDVADGHEVERSFRLLHAIGVPVATMIAPIQITATVESQITQWLDDHGVSQTDTLIALGVGAGETKRIWPVEAFAGLAQQLASARRKVVVVGGPMDRDAGAFLAKHGCLDGTVLPSLKHSAALLNRAALFVGNDSGPMHLAAAQGVPVVEISSHPIGGSVSHPHAPERFAPWNVPKVILRPGPGGSISDVAPADVLHAAMQLCPH